MFSRIIAGASILVLAVAIGACSGDSTGPAGDTLTDAEFDAMVEALAAVGSFDFGMGATGFAASPALSEGIEHRLAAETVSFTFEESVPCPDGGTVDVEGSVNGDFDSVTGAGTGSVAVTQTHRSCAGTAQVSGKIFVFNGDPSISMQMSFTVDENEDLVSLTGSQTGGIRWAVDDKEGRCGMNVTYSITGAQTATPSISIAGTLCNRTFDFQFQG
jgi:hypothetical protein